MMSYCVNCGAKISELEAKIHYDRCDECFSKTYFCANCDAIVSEQEVRLYHGRCFSCAQQGTTPQASLASFSVFRKTPRWMYYVVFVIFGIILVMNAVLALLTTKYGFLFVLVVITVCSPLIVFLYKTKSRIKWFS